ncbi:hypothetical protein GRJ2_000163700 [Grus japonensis]|uniref:Uncharacterized protein n=1 Tax=Grus japonensis TaxID=30415 RepID=A0ABC9VW10_GRUJA
MGSPRVLRELVEAVTKPLSIIYQQSWITREVSVDWKLADVTPIYKKCQKKDLGNLQACQSDLGAGEDYEDPPECHHAAHTGQQGNRAQSAWVYERQVLLDQPDLLL